MIGIKKRKVSDGIDFICFMILLIGTSMQVLSSCSKDEHVSSGNALASLRIQTYEGANLLKDEQTIQKIRLMIYDSAGKLEFNHLFEGTELKSVSDGYLIDKALESILSGTKTCYLIANETTKISQILTSGYEVTTLHDLEKFDLRWDVSQEMLQRDNLPFVSKQRVLLVPGDNILDFYLSFAVGRLDLRICRDLSLHGSTVQIESVQIQKAAPASRLLSDNPVSWKDEELISFTQKTDFPANGLIPDSIDEFLNVGSLAYLYESETQISDEATNLKVTVSINGDKVTGVFPLLCSSENTNKYGIRRNTMTRLSLAVYRDRFIVKTEHPDWNYESIDIEFTEDGLDGSNITGGIKDNDKWEIQTLEVEFE